jgi:hypothetical protein
MRRGALVALLIVSSLSCRKELPVTDTAPSARKTPAPSATPVAEPRDLKGVKIDEKLAHETTYVEGATLGAQKSADGTVQAESAKFKRGQPVYLTMRLKESPPGLQSRIEWKDAAGATVFQEQRPMGGAKVVTFELTKRLEPGGYRAVGYWGGNVACDLPFEVVGK